MKSHSILMLFALMFATQAAAETTFPISVSIVTENGVLIRDDAWIAAQIDFANSLYRPAGVQFRLGSRKEISTVNSTLHSREERDSLDQFVERNEIDVVVVVSLADLDPPGRAIYGVTWLSQAKGKRFIILSSAAPHIVLAHELGHYFGNAHTQVPDNLMSYYRTDTDDNRLFLDATQINRISRYAKQFIASGQLRSVGHTANQSAPK